MTKLHTAQRPVPTSTLGSRLRLTPLAYALTTMLMAGAFTTPARAQQAFSGGWFAAKGAAQNTAASSGRLPNRMQHRHSQKLAYGWVVPLCWALSTC